MLNRLYNWYGKRVVWGALFVMLILVATGLVLTFSDEEVADEVQNGRSVTVASVSELASGASIELVGTVEAESKAQIRSEVGGRITSVNVGLGDTIAAGTIIAEIENANERAGVLQAEGAYESALAAAAQSDVSLVDAQTTLRSAESSGINTHRSTFATIDDIVRNLADELYSNADAGIIGFRLEGPTRELNSRRIELRSTLADWRAKTATTDASNVLARLEEARVDALRVGELVELLANVVADEDNKDAVIAGNTMDAYQTRLAAARGSVNGAVQTLENAHTAILNAQDALRRAELSGTGGDISSANAQVKQALGSLRAAQARLAETIFRSPISGTVNELSVKTGDFINAFEHIATIANNDAFLITTYISESERNRVSIGDTVRIGGGATGTITTIAPAVNEATKKVEVQIQVDEGELSTGETVRITLEHGADNAINTQNGISIPVSALKVETDRIVVFTVGDDDTLIAHEVEDGPLVGENILIESGITPEMVIVRDARGLSEGDRVTVIN